MYQKPTLELIGEVREVVLGLFGEGADLNGMDFRHVFDFLPDSGSEGTEADETTAAADRHPIN